MAKKKGDNKSKSVKRDSPNKNVKGKMVKPLVKKPDTKVKERVETNIDKLYELVRDKGILKVKVASEEFGIKIEQIEEWGRILEEHNLIKLHYPPIGDPVLILRKFKSDVKKIEGKEKMRPGRKVFIINFVILLAFIVFVAFYMIKIPVIQISYTQAFLALIVVIIIGIVLILKFRKGRKK